MSRQNWMDLKYQDNPTLSNKLQVSMNNCPRNICLTWWPERIKNRDRINQDLMTQETAKKKRWRWKGHNLTKSNNNTNNNRIQRCNSRFLTISSLRHEPSPAHMLKWTRCNCVQIMCNTSSTHHVQHVMLCAVWYKGTAQLLSLTELKLHLC